MPQIHHREEEAREVALRGLIERAVKVGMRPPVKPGRTSFSEAPRLPNVEGKTAVDLLLEDREQSP